MASFFTITTASTISTILTEAERRAMAGLQPSDASQDTALLALDQRVTASIMQACAIREADEGENAPTLFRERISQTIEVETDASAIYLARRFNVEVVTITLGGSAQDESEYFVQSAAGLLKKRGTAPFNRWLAGSLIVVDYWAGFTTAPYDLRQAALDCFRVFYQEATRDPLVKRQRIDIPGLENRETDYWVGSIPGQTREGPVPDVVMGQLSRFKNEVAA